MSRIAKSFDPLMPSPLDARFSVADAAAREAIAVKYRGMKGVYQEDTETYYKLVKNVPGDIDDPTNRVLDTAGGGSVINDVTYAQLDNLIGTGTLVPFDKYRITDYETRYINSSDEFTVHTVEPIIVTAITESTIDPIAISESHPTDIITYNPTQESFTKSQAGVRVNGPQPGDINITNVAQIWFDCDAQLTGTYNFDINDQGIGNSYYTQDDLGTLFTLAGSPGAWTVTFTNPSMDMDGGNCEIYIDEEYPVGSNKGKITYRVETIYNNEFNFDFRGIKTRLYAIDVASYPVWTASTTYSPGDLVTFGGDIEMCIKKSNRPAFTPSEFKRILSNSTALQTQYPLNGPSFLTLNMSSYNDYYSNNGFMQNSKVICKYGNSVPVIYGYANNVEVTGRDTVLVSTYDTRIDDCIGFFAPQCGRMKISSANGSMYDTFGNPNGEGKIGYIGNSYVGGMGDSNIQQIFNSYVYNVINSSILSMSDSYIYTIEESTLGNVSGLIADTIDNSKIRMCSNFVLNGTTSQNDFGRAVSSGVGYSKDAVNTVHTVSSSSTNSVTVSGTPFTINLDRHKHIFLEGYGLALILSNTVDTVNFVPLFTTDFTVNPTTRFCILTPSVGGTSGNTISDMDLSVIGTSSNTSVQTMVSSAIVGSTTGTFDEVDYSQILKANNDCFFHKTTNAYLYGTDGNNFRRVSTHYIANCNMVGPVSALDTSILDIANCNWYFANGSGFSANTQPSFNSVNIGTSGSPATFNMNSCNITSLIGGSITGTVKLSKITASVFDLNTQTVTHNISALSGSNMVYNGRGSVPDIGNDEVSKVVHLTTSGSSHKSIFTAYDYTTETQVVTVV